MKESSEQNVFEKILYRIYQAFLAVIFYLAASVNSRDIEKDNTEE